VRLALRRRWLSIASVALFAGSACACRFEPDPRSLTLRLSSVPLAFVGRVAAVEGGQARFIVELALRGQPGSEQRVTIGHGSCAIRFQSGDRWLFAGPSLPDPSMRLGLSSATLSSAVAPLRAAGLVLPPVSP
jgi:hypothetical protein